MPMSIDELRELRIQLKISQTEISKILNCNPCTISYYESHTYGISDEKAQKYQNYLTDVIDGKIKPQHDWRVGKTGGIPSWLKRGSESVTIKEAKISRLVRRNLGISQCEVAPLAQISVSSLKNKELGQQKMFKTEYEALMSFYKQEKLKRIFGKNYKEKAQ